MLDQGASILRSDRWRDRFEIQRQLGQGGMGTVYEAIDHDRGLPIALKLLRELRPDLLQRFKYEFRTLADLHHPNLVSLGELIEDDGQWFFTMELVEGSEILGDLGCGCEQTEDSTVSEDPVTGADESQPAPKRIAKGEFAADIERVRQTFSQLAVAVHDLHEAGMIHRDLKPANIKVTPQGRVVLLDFGLVRDLLDDGDEAMARGRVVGTPAYMAPEQARSRDVDPAADWYAFGVILFRALTGELPFEGQALEMLRAKLESEAPAPSSFVADLPEDLDRLCVDLLRRLPEERPRGVEVLKRMGLIPGRSQLPGRTSPSAPFIGRDRELGALLATYGGVADQPRVMVIRGATGIGKSCLIDRFCGLLRGRGVTVLRGRCYERESMAYKGFDGVAEDLVRVFREQPALLERQSAAISLCAEVFPALWRLRSRLGIHRATAHSSLVPQERRRELFLSLREIFRELSNSTGLVLAIDDIHWADPDSFNLLRALLEGPDAPPMMLLACASDEPISESVRPWLDLHLIVEEIELKPLDRASALGLARFLVAEHDSSIDLKHLIDEGRGHPMFIEEMVHHFAKPGAPLERGIGYREMVSDRLDELDQAEHEVLELVAVAAHPIAQGLVREAASLSAKEFSRLVAKMRMARLVRTSGIRQDDHIEIHHPRIAEIVLESCDQPVTLQRNRQLALAVEAKPDQAEVEDLVHYWLDAGESEVAAVYASRAAAKAEERLAFDRAARLLQTAIELSTEVDVDLLARYAEVLVQAGKGREAAEQFLLAAEATSGLRAFKLRGEGGEQLLFTGHLERAVEIVEDLVGDLGWSFPHSRRQKVIDLALSRLGLWLRGRRLVGGLREADACSPSALVAADVCFSVGLGFALVDPTIAAIFLGRAVRLANETREPRRVVRAMCVDAGLWSARGIAAVPRARRLIAAARDIAEEAQIARDNRWLLMANAVIAYLSGDWLIAQEAFDDLETVLRRMSKRNPWQFSVCAIWSSWCHYYTGELERLAEETDRGLAEAELNGDLFTLAGLSMGPAAVRWLINDRPAEVHRRVSVILGRWKGNSFQVQHWWAVRARVEACLYCGDSGEAERLLAEASPQLEAASMRRLAIVDIEFRSLDIRVRTMAERPEDDPLLREHLRNLRSRADSWAWPLADAGRAELMLRAGDRQGALASFEGVIAGFEDLGMTMHRHAAAWRHAQVLGGEVGAAQAETARRWFEDRGVVDPVRFVSRLMPRLER